jgi:hypothetical protein
MSPPVIPAGPDTPAAQVAGRMAEAAGAWLAALTPQQRRSAVGAAPSTDGEVDAERRRWFYTPTDHGGLTLHEQRPAQQRLAMTLVSTGLSHAGFVTVSTVIGMENVLDHADGFSVSFGRERGRDPGMYYLRVFGEPGGERPWGWRFGGHHVSVSNLVVDGELVATTPSFIGADPATSPLLGGDSLRPLGPTEDLARELIRSLPRELVRQALLTPRAPSDIVGGNRSTIADGDRMIPLAGVWRGRFADADEWSKLQQLSDRIDEQSGLSVDDHAALALTTRPRGLPGSALDATQREMLRAVLSAYLDRVPAEVSAAGRYASSPDGDAALDAVHLAWAGSVTAGEPHYYRLQGPRLLIEYDNTQRDVNHAHAAWRDPETDFGLDALGVTGAASRGLPGR